MYFSKNSYVYKNTFVRDFTGNIPDEKVIFIPHEKKEPVGMVMGDFTNVGTKWVRTGTDYLDKDVYFVIEYGAHLNDSLPTTPIVYNGSFIAPQEQQVNNIEVINYPETINYPEIVEEQNNNLLISVPETNFLLGDVDGDGIITSNDANLIQQYIVGNINLTPAQLLAADVDGDGIVTAYDASLILQIVEADNISPVIIDPEPVIPDPYTPPVIPDPYTPPVIPDPENGIDVRYLTIEQLNNFPTNDLKKYFINNNEYTISSITLEEDLVTVKIISNAYYVYRFYDQVLLHVYNYDPFAQLNFYNYTPPVVPDPYTPPVVPDPYTPPAVPDPYTPPVVPETILSNKKAVLAVALLAAVFIMSK